MKIKVGKSKYHSNIATKKMYLGIALGVLVVAVVSVCLYFLLPRKTGSPIIETSVSVDVKDQSLMTLNSTVYKYNGVLSKEDGEYLAKRLQIKNHEQILEVDGITPAYLYSNEYTTNNDGQYKPLSKSNQKLELNFEDSYTYFIVQNLENHDSSNLGLTLTSKIDIPNTWNCQTDNLKAVSFGELSAKNLVVGVGVNDSQTLPKGTIDLDYKVEHSVPAIAKISSPTGAEQSFDIAGDKLTTTYVSTYNENEDAHLVNVVLDNVNREGMAKVEVLVLDMVGTWCNLDVFSTICTNSTTSIGDLWWGENSTSCSVQSIINYSSVAFGIQFKCNIDTCPEDAELEFQITIEFLENHEFAKQIQYSDIKQSQQGLDIEIDESSDLLNVEIMDITENAMIQITPTYSPSSSENICAIFPEFINSSWTALLYVLGQRVQMSGLATEIGYVELDKGLSYKMCCVNSNLVSFNIKIAQLNTVECTDKMLEESGVDCEFETKVETYDSKNLHFVNFVVDNIQQDSVVSVEFDLSNYTNVQVFGTDYIYDGIKVADYYYVDYKETYVPFVNDNKFAISISASKGKFAKVFFAFMADELTATSVTISANITCQKTSAFISYADLVDATKPVVLIDVTEHHYLAGEGVYYGLCNFKITDVTDGATLNIEAQTAGSMVIIGLGNMTMADVLGGIEPEVLAEGYNATATITADAEGNYCFFVIYLDVSQLPETLSVTISLTATE